MQEREETWVCKNCGSNEGVREVSSYVGTCEGYVEAHEETGAPSFTSYGDTTIWWDCYDDLGWECVGCGTREVVLEQLVKQLPAQDEIILLPSGTELSIEAALGDLERAENFLADPYTGSEEEAEGIRSDLIHVRELIQVIAGGGTGGS